MTESGSNYVEGFGCVRAASLMMSHRKPRPSSLPVPLEAAQTLSKLFYILSSLLDERP
jgi:hypothetical protein